ncbi:MAG: anhydro-N-acetylmuramic acid kinase [Rhodospirillales bacterium]|nr:anhydro-N-acetylmuramic acid kinase [Alphaproteobacteria bacterium]MCB9986765.1 anhydro-N-acetylmuramic acid kinase [Rhodospirillales bacterium]USO08464.1 MAG: anhydro-N-acetylmuramic acid kinase [Rhodospirillales bacterium]
MAKTQRVLGLMSGTSMDGIDAALLHTDGIAAGEVLARAFTPYPETVRAAIRAVLGRPPENEAAAIAQTLVTDWHINAVRDFGHAGQIDLIAFHGQTVFHDPANARTWQIGDGPRLAAATGLPVMYDFRSNDMRHGGQGAPLLPLYHRALVRKAELEEPAAVLNLGGVANITWIDGEAIYACDTGPASALIDDWMRRATGESMDRNGETALKGAPDRARIQKWLENPYFARTLPKSLDRDAFASCRVDDLSPEDGAATLAAFTVAGVFAALDRLPGPTRRLLVCGGGRHNAAIMRGLETRLPVTDADTLGWSGDFIEAEGFAYLAARARAGLPLTLPTTTGCLQPVSGGILVEPDTIAAS